MSAILIKIFRYLNFGDVQTVSAVCREWLEITKLEEFQSQILVKFSGINISDDNEPASIFLKRTRLFRNLILKNCEMENCDQFLKIMGETIESISFELCNKMTTNNLITIIDSIANLQELTIKNWWGFEKFGLLDTDDINSKNLYLNYIERPKHALSKLKKLHLHVKNSSACQEIAVRLTETNEKTLKDICFDFSGPMPLHRTFVWYNLLQLDNLNLEKFKLNRHFFPSEDFFSFIISQNNLKELHLRGLHYLHDEEVEIIVSNLKYLEVFKVPFCYHVSNRSLGSLMKIKNLSVIEISNLVQPEAGIDDVVTDMGIANSIARSKNEKLMEMSVGSIRLSDIQMKLIIPNLMSLRVLNIEANDSDSDKITDETVQTIITNLRWLRVLNMQNNVMITDFGLTGINSHTNELEGSSVSQLKGLKCLNVKNCKKLTDKSIVNGIKFLELNKLSIGEYPHYEMIENNLKFIDSTRLTEIGIQVLAENCPSLEILDFSTSDWDYLKYLKYFTKLKSYIVYKKCSKCERMLQFNSVDKRHDCIMCNIIVE